MKPGAIRVSFMLTLNSLLRMGNTTKGRVLISKLPKEGFELADKIYKKHKADGATSELKNLDGLSWDVVGPTIAAGLAANEEAERLKGLMEAQYRLRDAA